MVSTWTGRSGVVLVAALIVIVGLVGAACGGGSSAGGTPDQTAPTPTAAAETGAEPTAVGPMDGPAPNPTKIEVEARDNVFDVQPAQGVPGAIEAPANTEITVRLVNEGVLPHNIAFFREQGGTILSEDANSDIILEGESTSITFKTPAPGTYFFQCTVHPLEMIGEFIVK